MNFRTKLIVIVSLLLVSLTASVAFAQSDGRINPAPYHFGGDALYCNNTDGCTLLNKDGQFLYNWTQAQIAAAFEALEASGQNTLVEAGAGSYGTAELWAVLPEANSTVKRLCFFAFDEHGKQNWMCFGVTANWVYLPLRLAPDATKVADCSMWSVGLLNYVRLIADHGTWGLVMSINPTAGELTFSNFGGSSEPITAGCDEVEVALI